jgi:hypothetical protein
MKLRMLLAAGIGIALALGPSPASAKGPESIRIKGPGLEDPIRLDPERDGQIPMRLIEAAGLFEAFDAQPGSTKLQATAPSEDLGPRYVAVYTLFGPEGDNPTVRQRLYPFANDGPLVHTPGGQSLFDGPTADGGWLRADNSLRVLLVAMGVPRSD